MNPIEQAIKDLDPDYETTGYQQLYISQSEDPEAVAEVLAQQVESNRERIASGLGVPEQFVTAGDGISAADLRSPVKAQSAGRDGMRVAAMVSPARLTRIGMRVGAASAPEPEPAPMPKAGPLHAIYAAVLGREPDAEGLAFWRGHYEGGMRLSEVIRWVEDSPEAQR